MPLIPSSRHSPEDLAAWATHERNDARRLLGRGRARLERIAEQAGGVIRDAAAGAYCGVSWGKDSVVVAHLVRVNAPDVPLVWVRLPGGWDNPDCELVRDAFLAAWPGPYEEVWCPEPRVTPEGLATGSRAPGYTECARRWPRRITGIRAQESRTRRMALAAHGDTTARTCSPVARWAAADVWLYLHAHGLPVHPAYACTRGGTLDRDWLRVASLGGLRGTGHGRREWERHYYGDELARLGL